MKKYIAVIALLQLSLVAMIPNTAVAEKAVPLSLGAVKVYPVLEVKESYDDNIFLEKNTKTGSFVTKLTPSVRIVAKSGANQVTVQYRISKGFYHKSSSDNYLDQNVAIGGKFGLTKRLNMGVSLGYKKSHYSRGSTFLGVGSKTFNSPDKFHEVSLGGKVSYGVRGRIDLTGLYTNFRYDNNVLRAKDLDVDTLGSVLAFSFPIGLKTRAVVETRFKLFNYLAISRLGDLDNNEQSYLAGLDWQASAKTNGGVRVGYVKKKFLNTAFTNFAQLSWELNATWQPLSSSSVQLNAFSKPIESDGTSRFIVSNALNMAWKHHWTQAFSHRLSMGYDSRDYKGLARQDKIASASLGLDYNLLRWLSVGGDYRFRNRNSSVTNSSYRQNIWSLRVRGML